MYCSLLGEIGDPESTLTARGLRSKVKSCVGSVAEDALNRSASDNVFSFGLLPDVIKHVCQLEVSMGDLEIIRSELLANYVPKRRTRNRTAKEGPEPLWSPQSKRPPH